ncbi:uncharacterized protein B0I36DRAFT_246458 [Microdochium trichocladiopsis]|uniref:Apple domain-containing protein n=1 Tax=Microdochium trichocladiopsis TaxID=1682393 RepID=A0A9P9BLF6_9PEZI|nr:uncharacterized protein B0I36DRAFT_246458 [Microdochium trichocladiopsis]KAH7028027.1 hypothetical protein B0I36DRAFT_246458 [Microdochium trichocladiopsis]
MKATTALLAPAALLAAVSSVLASPTGVSDNDAPSTTTTSASSCTAPLIAELCDYPPPENAGYFAIAASGPSTCWEHCAKNAPCNFSVFLLNNPYTGTGTCWMYPGQSYNPAAGQADGCTRKSLSVYGQPTCSDPEQPIGGTNTAPPACAATASPSPVAKICDYPPPPDGCFNSCAASASSAACLSQCAQSDSCAFAIFNPGNEPLDPNYSGNCWMYPEGAVFDPKLAGTCKGDKPEQYVYQNTCPKIVKPSPSSSSEGGGGGAAGGASPTPGPSGTGGDVSGGAAAAAGASSAPAPEKAAANGLAQASAGSVVLGAALLLWQALA